MNWSPKEYNDAAVLALRVGEEMLSRLDWVTIKPAVILDVGCGVGGMSLLLRQRYPLACVLSVDRSMEMVMNASSAAMHSSSRMPADAGLEIGSSPSDEAASCGRADGGAGSYICADGERLPVLDSSVDLIYANFLLPWMGDIKQVFAEWRRVLKPDGVLLFSALGLDTLKEWRDVFLDEHIPQLLDMHDVGDELLLQRFADPVLDVCHYSMTYGDKSKFISELFASGMLQGQPDLSALDEIVLEEGDQLSVTYEVIIGHAFAPPESHAFAPAADGVAKVPLSYLRKQLAK